MMLLTYFIIEVGRMSFADNLKISKPIKTILDVSNLKRDLDALLSWCEVHNLDLNENKCKCMSFYRLRSSIIFDCSTINILIARVSDMHDLGVLYDEKIIFVRHFDYIKFKNLFHASPHDENMRRV